MNSDLRRIEIKEMVARHNAYEAANPRAPINHPDGKPLHPLIARKHFVKPYKRPLKAAVCERCCKVMATAASLAGHRCPLKRQLPILPLLKASQEHPFLTLPHSYNNRKIKIKTKRFTSNGKAVWEYAEIVRDYSVFKYIMEGKKKTKIEEKKLHIRFTGPYRSKHKKREFRGIWHS